MDSQVSPQITTIGSPESDRILINKTFCCLSQKQAQTLIIPLVAICQSTSSFLTFLRFVS